MKRYTMKNYKEKNKHEEKDDLAYDEILSKSVESSNTMQN